MFDDNDTRDKVLDTMTFLITKLSESFDERIEFVNELERKLIEQAKEAEGEKIVKDGETKKISGSVQD